MDLRNHHMILTSHEASGLAPKLIHALDGIGASPQSLNISQPTLEDVFVKLVGHGIQDDESQLVRGRDPFVEGRL